MPELFNHYLIKGIRWRKFDFSNSQKKKLIMKKARALLFLTFLSEAFKDIFYDWLALVLDLTDYR